jgi:anionic cell wall polymer biosynthesis LytR-Cps2A-Psr (LCP) family protein
MEKGFYAYEHGRLAVMMGDDVHLNESAPAGLYHMKGHSALLYMRIRKSSRTDTDFMRTQRVRNVLSVLADKCRDFSLDQANDLANSIMQHNDATNMTLKEMMDAAAMAYSLRDCTIEEFRVPAQEDVRSITFGNMSALEINWTSTRKKYLEFLDHSTLVRDVDYIVEEDDN